MFRERPIVTAVKISLVVLLVVLLAIVALRVRKLRRDDERDFIRRQDPRLMVPPPSPYSPSSGFRLLDAGERPSPPSAPARPRLEPDKRYVFSDYHPSNPDFATMNASKRDMEWALARSATRSNATATSLRVVAVVLAIVIALGVIGYYRYEHQRGHHHHSTTSTVTTTTL